MYSRNWFKEEKKVSANELVEEVHLLYYNGPIYHISDRTNRTDRAEIADIDGKSEILTNSLTTHRQE